MVKLPKTHSVLVAALTAFAVGVSLTVFATLATAEQPPAPARASHAAATKPAGQLVQRGAPAASAPAATPTVAVEDKRNENGIVAIVNDHPISAYDLRQRVALVTSTNNIPPTPEMMKKLREQILEKLETELIRRQEALKNDITVSAAEVDRQIQGIVTDNHMTLDQLKDVLAHGKVAMATLRGQIAADILWQKAVEMQYSGRINITPEAVDAAMARMAEGANKAHFLVLEIFLPVDNPDQDEKVLKDAQNLVTQIQGGAPFNAIARQFSQSPSAAGGGDIGLVYDGQLAPELNQALEKMKTGDMSQPIRSTGGYYILLLRQRLEPADAEIVEADPTSVALPASLPLARLLLPVPPTSKKELLDQALKFAENIRQNISNCQILPKIAEKIPHSVYQDLGMMKLSDLSQQIRDVLAKTEPGGAAAPFMSAAGVELFVRCDKAIVKKQKFILPSRDEVEHQLFNEQISAMARRYDRDLRRNADIEVR